MPIAVGQSALKGEVEVAQAEMPILEEVKWWREPGLRRLYFWASVLCVASATTGYDGLAWMIELDVEKLEANYGAQNDA